MSKKNLPRYVTLVSKVYFGNCSVVKLVKEGPKYYHTTHVWRDPDTGEEQERDQVGAPFKSDKDRYILLEGKRWGMQKRLQQIKREYDERSQKHGHEREQAKWKALSAWDQEHPWPTLPKLEDLLDEDAKTK